ncbi:hypothetical protein GSI_04216 [Ganoderma sinense ZZ0214-1]|uniref:Uncharacterized protein n=1 Tax=Ganoderma sinense ZZ0214-1 TaxID=1077348 RepID=A0A2G8SIJ7_9APHY|nr:hypothetical protein GSI_04216 [Ganoderma sinense ZZ0214-1]
MWLLSTDRAELHHFPSPEAIIGGYAILSHTWGDNEQTFQETQALRHWCKEIGKNPRDFSSEKVRQCCILAERHGYHWVWDDTCCIDKTSSSELSEAINSMFLWYSCAEVCFAYLAEVESSCQLDAPMSAFRTARWHSRGWTLQELIAPTVVIFVSRDWQAIGNKVELALLLQEVTGVFSRVLTREVHCSTVSVAERMLWASKRSTTRVEDEAYCLMGLFNVNMPTIYGEGRQAFRRLQQEIMKQSFDTSLFAWGACTRLHSVTPVMPQEIYRFLNTSSQHHVYVLADSPKRFLKPWGRTIRYTPSANDPLQPYLDHQVATNPVSQPDSTGARTQSPSGPFGPLELPMFSVTSYGLKCRFPIIESDRLTVAVLLCDNSREHIGLFLHPSNDSLRDPSRRRYNIGHGFRNASNYVGFARLVSLGNDFYNLRLRGKPVTAQWRDVFIADSPPPTKTDVASTLCSRLHSIAPAPPFRLPHWLIGRLALVGMELQNLNVEDAPADGVPFRMAATFEDVNVDEGLCLILGTCTQLPSGPAHWARAIIPQCSAPLAPESHDCREHHIHAWPGRAKDFGDAERTVRLSFSRCTLTPAHTLVVHIELEGRVYNALKERKNIMLPSWPSPGYRAVRSLVDSRALLPSRS